MRKAQGVMKKGKVIRVSPRQCNTGDTVGGKMSKLSANHPVDKNWIINKVPVDTFQ